MLKKIGLALLLLVLAFVGIAYLLPRHVPVNRSIVIDRPVGHIYPLLNSFARFNEFSPWFELDPAAKYTISTPPEGLGAKQSWEGNAEVGKGSIEIIENSPNKFVVIRLKFEGMPDSTYRFDLSSQAGGTKVDWTLDADMGNNPIGRWMGFAMDGMVGKAYDQGLAKLKTLVESFPKADFSDLAVSRVVEAAQPILYVEKSTTAEPAVISKAYEEAYGELMEFVQGNTIETVGAPIGIEVKDTPEQYVFRAALAIVVTEATPTGQIQRGESYAGDALKATHLGAYDKMGETVDKLRAYAAVHKLKVSAQPIYVFVDDPTTVAAEAVKTEVLLPVAQ